jgi:prolipoprotein diacylglyceryl transferase
MFDVPPGPIAFQLGPIAIGWYGLCYAIGLAVAYFVLVQLARRAGEDPDLVGNGIIVVAIAALIGGRVYHVIDQWHLYANDPLKIVLPPYSGLGVYGGIVTGTLAGWWYARRRRAPFARWADIVAPALFVMQAIGRWGNYFNQELYGRPTTLPWALEIDAQHLPSNGQYPVGTTFHPTFLYESIWNLLLFGALLWIDRKFKLANGQLLAIYVLGYGIGRLWVESLRIDEAHHLWGLRWNQWVAILLILAAGGWLLFTMGAPRERVYPKRDVPPNTDHDETAALAMATAGLPGDDGASVLVEPDDVEIDDGDPADVDDGGTAEEDPEPQPTPDDSADEPERPPKT